MRDLIMRTKASVIINYNLETFAVHYHGIATDK